MSGELLIVVLVLIIVVLLIAKWRAEKRHERYFVRLTGMVDESHAMLQTAEERWRAERQQLLDRIQAPSFDHLKHHEVKVIKAQQGEREPPKLDPL